MNGKLAIDKTMPAAVNFSGKTEESVGNMAKKCYFCIKKMKSTEWRSTTNWENGARNLPSDT